NTKSLGIEHASASDIRQALKGVYELSQYNLIEITKNDLIYHGLIGGPKAKSRRDRLGELLLIGHTNGKQLLKRLTMFQITKAQFESTMKQIIQEEKDV